MLSIIISSFNRANLFKKVLWNLAARPPLGNFELIVVDEESTDNIQGLLEQFSSRVTWKLVKVKTSEIENKLGIKKYYNNPSCFYNIGFKHSVGDIIAIQGNECIPIDNCYDVMLGEFSVLCEKYKNLLLFSLTYNMPEEQVATLDEYGSSIGKSLVRYCMQWPLQSPNYKSEVINYLSMCKRESFEAIRGFDTRYTGGIACEDSDFVRRVRSLGDYHYQLSKGITIHLGHGGKNIFSDSKVVSKEFWDEGVRINREIFHAWDGKPQVPCLLPDFDVEVITNFK